MVLVMLGQDCQVRNAWTQLGRHRGRKECLLCDAECESVNHVLWLHTLVLAFMLELRRELGALSES